MKCERTSTTKQAPQQDDDDNNGDGCHASCVIGHRWCKFSPALLLSKGLSPASKLQTLTVLCTGHDELFFCRTLPKSRQNECISSSFAYKKLTTLLSGLN